MAESTGTLPKGVNHSPLDMIANGAPRPVWFGQRMM
jgi:hypothetical protein